MHGDPEISLPSLFLRWVEDMNHHDGGEKCIAILVSEALADYAPHEFEGIPVYWHETEDENSILFVTEFFVTRDDISA